jgi:aromatic ring-opening dioxygenase catalytic subunit (LigB family)
MKRGGPARSLRTGSSEMAHGSSKDQANGDQGNPTARQFHKDIEDALAEKAHPKAAPLAAKLTRMAKCGGRAAWHFMKEHPFVSVLALGAAATLVAAQIGVAEITLGGAVAFAAYKVIREGEPPLKAIEQELERRL